jgi:hypothetical protein
MQRRDTLLAISDRYKNGPRNTISAGPFTIPRLLAPPRNQNTAVLIWFLHLHPPLLIRSRTREHVLLLVVVDIDYFVFVFVSCCELPNSHTGFPSHSRSPCSNFSSRFRFLNSSLRSHSLSSPSSPPHLSHATFSTCRLANDRVAQRNLT